MNILITGAAGFIGSSLAARLVADGQQVIAVARVLSQKLASPEFGDRLIKIIAPVEKTTLVPLLQKYQPDVLIHCAGTGTVSQAQGDPQSSFNSTVGTVSEALEAVREFSPKTLFLLISSASVYGDRGNVLLHESLMPHPMSAYGYSKAMAEMLVQQYASQFGISALVVRPFSVYGELQQKQVIYDLCAKLVLLPNELALMGSGEETRDFLHIDDLASSILSLIRLRYTGVVNLGTGISTKIVDLVRQIADQLSPQTHIVFGGSGRTTDPGHLVADVKLSNSLGIFPTISLRSGLEQICTTVATSAGVRI